MQKQFSGEAFSTNGAGATECPQREKPQSKLHTLTKINSKWIRDLTGKCRTTKFLFKKKKKSSESWANTLDVTPKV